MKKLLDIQEEQKESIEVLQMPEEKTMDNVISLPVLTRSKHKDNDISKAA